LFTADATINNGTLELTGNSLGLLRDVQLILLGFGIQSSIFGLGDGGAMARGMVAGACGAGDSSALSVRHGLRIEPGSLRLFAEHIALLPGKKLGQLASAAGVMPARRQLDGNYDRIASLAPAGRRQVFDLTEPLTSSSSPTGWSFTTARNTCSSTTPPAIWLR